MQKNVVKVAYILNFPWKSIAGKNISEITLFSFYESINLNNHTALITTHLQAASLTY